MVQDLVADMEEVKDVAVPDEAGEQRAPDLEDLRTDPEITDDVTDVAEVEEDVVEEVVEPRMRHFTFKGIAGISMGANALVFHVRHPGHFDFVAAYGGYINYHYFAPLMRDRIFGGFCDLESLLAHVDELDDPQAPNLDCGPVAPLYPWEFSWNFNHWHYDDSGGTWDRDFYWDAIEGMMTGFGNMLNFNPDHPYLPAGVTVDWLARGDTHDRCANPQVLGKPYNYNAEYNPEGEYNLITFCDGEEPIPGGKNNPDFLNLVGVYDPTYFHTRPVHFFLAVDLNGNGKRDFHEPIVINTHERFQDTGPDGCFDEFEDGMGGCTATGAVGDPNADNYDFHTNPMGTQGNGWWEPGEPFFDYGLDGVPETGDFGEGDGEWSMNPNLATLIEGSPSHWIDNASKEDLDAVDIFLDGGIRDSLHAATSMWALAQRLAARVKNTRFYHDFTLFEDSFYHTGERVLLTDVPVDWTAQGVGKNFMVAYGDPDASADMIRLGDGKHVGLGEDVFNRAATMFIAPLHRWPDIDVDPVPPGNGGVLKEGTYHSPAVQNRYRYAISLPPGYFMPENQDQTYPIFIYLPGHGMTAMDTIAAGLVFNMFMELGLVGKFILAVPEGQCCRIHKDTGTRYCACIDRPGSDGVFSCSDPTCTGTNEECPEIEIPKNRTEQECVGGHFYANHKTNRWGDTSAAEYMRYEDALVDLVHHLDATYRTRPAGDYLYYE
jgi:hypothetical protein